MCFCFYNCMGDLGPVVKTEICIWNCWAVQSKHTKGKIMLILIRLHKMCACFPGNPFFKQHTLSTLTNSDESKLSAYWFQLVLASVEETTLFQISEAVSILKECFSDVPLFSCWKQSFETRFFFSIFISKFGKTFSEDIHFISVLFRAFFDQTGLVSYYVCSVMYLDCPGWDSSQEILPLPCHLFPVAVLVMSWCLMSSDVIWHIRDKLWPMPKHGSIKSTYVRCMRV